jgi:hypothetical protein
MRDDKGSNLMTASPVFLLNTSKNPITANNEVQITGAGAAGLVVQTVNTGPGQVVDASTVGLSVSANMLVFNPALAWFEGVRTPTKYGFASCTTVAATDVFAPTAGKKFRLLRCIIWPSAGLAAAGIETISLQEETLGNFLTVQTWCPIAASVAAQAPLVIDLTPNGYLATTVTKKFQIVLGTAATAGGIGVSFIGTEE